MLNARARRQSAHVRDLRSKYTRLLMLRKCHGQRQLEAWLIEPENVVVQRGAATGGCVETAEQAAAGHVHEEVARVLAPSENLAAHDVVEVVGM